MKIQRDEDEKLPALVLIRESPQGFVQEAKVCTIKSSGDVTFHQEAGSDEVKAAAMIVDHFWILYNSVL